MAINTQQLTTGTPDLDDTLVGTQDDTLTRKFLVSAIGDLVAPAASETTAGKAELATTAEINTGTDAARVMAVDQFAASNFGTAVLWIPIGDSTTSAFVGDGLWGVAVPASMNGMNVVNVIAVAYTAGATNTTDFQLRRRRSGASADVLSTKVTMAAQTVCSDGVINASNDDLATGDLLFADVDAIETTAPIGVGLLVEARLP